MISSLKNFYHNYAGKIFWTLAPLLWGAISWFFMCGPGECIPITRSMLLIISIVILVAYFYKILERKQNTVRLIFFDHPFSIPNWKWLFIPTIALLTAQSFAASGETILSSMAFGVFASAFLEELLTRLLFIKYRMSALQFIVFNTISSAAFTIMHAGYCMPIPSLLDLFTRGHFPFSFMLGILAYKTQRIELPMLVHMSSNLMGYTLPTLILQHPIPQWIYAIIACIQYLLVAGVVGVQKNTAPDKELER